MVSFAFRWNMFREPIVKLLTAHRWEFFIQICNIFNMHEIKSNVMAFFNKTANHLCTSVTFGIIWRENRNEVNLTYFWKTCSTQFYAICIYFIDTYRLHFWVHTFCDIIFANECMLNFYFEQIRIYIEYKKELQDDLWFRQVILV